MNQPLIVGINGSPNIKGNTAFMLEQALNKARYLGAQTEILHCQKVLRGQRKSFCTARSSPCTGSCYQGKALDDAFKIISRADGILVGSPVYFGTVSAQLKAFWDKSRLLRTQKRLMNVVGGAITVGNSKYGGQENVLRTIHDIYLVHGMIIVGDGHDEDDCGHMGAAARRPAQSDTEAIERCVILGKRLYQVALTTRSLRERKG